jgi:hypothetical protein
MTRKKQTENYVNNKEFLAAISEYRQKVIAAKASGKPRPRVTNYLGECFLKIATHLSYKPNFVNYMFREDMICDGIENCLQYIDNFDPEKSTNPFAYSFVVFRKKRNSLRSRVRSLSVQDMTKLCTQTHLMVQ